MGSLSIWHFLIILVIFIPSLLVVALENSGKRLRPWQYAKGVGIRILAILALAFLRGFAIGLMGESNAELAFGIGILVGLATWILVLSIYRLMVQRLRDGGEGKAAAYVAVVPGISFVLMIALAFVPKSKS